MPHRTFDAVATRCPQLGSEVTFGYCRAVADGLPCRRALVCFAQRFPVQEFFRRALRPQTFARVFRSPPEDPATRLLRAILR